METLHLSVRLSVCLPRICVCAYVLRANITKEVKELYNEN